TNCRRCDSSLCGPGTTDERELLDLVCSLIRDIDGVQPGNTRIEVRKKERIGSTQCGAVQARKAVQCLTAGRRRSGANGNQASRARRRGDIKLSPEYVDGSQITDGIIHCR